MKTKTTSKTASACRRHQPNKALRPAFCGAPRGGVSIESTRKVNASLPPGMIGFNPFRLSTITISENDYYSLAIFALRYAMGGGTIGQNAVIGEVISSVGFSELGERIASVIVPDYESYVRLHLNGDESKVDEVWRLSYRWLKALRDDAFTLVHTKGKANGKTFSEDIVAFDTGDSWRDAKFFVSNQIASRNITINSDLITSTEPLHWKDLLEEGY